LLLGDAFSSTSNAALNSLNKNSINVDGAGVAGGVFGIPFDLGLALVDLP
jgi:hypothetical protein